MADIIDKQQSRMEYFRFDRNRFCVQESVDLLALQNARFEATPDQYFRDRMIYRLTTYLASNEVKTETTASEDKGKPVEQSRETKTTEVPLTWWDHAKQTLNARWPKLNLKCNLRTITTTERVYLATTVHTTNNKHIHICPHIQADSERVHVLWMLDRPTGDFK